ncbi:hypothetical protein P171DRAFT_490182 [Karstenula rhodostoma CBS 690.94]|uniref:VIT-domain-containing protein n=1 Tax=Karstenula rhodostoma CBS 690.94 TaxID=1392251 RepID=A0A9P4PAK2_9PLEO|nr:hypothetical protein P171DRAFT_490182 [Karstenula rhodostoma CBS 690.94]
MFGNITQKPASLCGLYYTHSYQDDSRGIFSGVVNERVFLPQVQLEAHATILQTTSRVTLTQTFINPSSTKAIREVKYVFPLYEGVSVVGFTCHVADRTIVGEVKEKNEAKQDYAAAVERGETAGLFQQLDTSDTFMTTIGNVTPGVRVVIELTYLGELKHDMEVDGIRFTIPNIITPRYGRTAPGSDAALAQFQRYTPSRGGYSGNISIIVDVEMTEGSFIQKVLSPSHPISVSMGTTSIAPNNEPRMSKASASLGIQSTHLDTDFILQIVTKDTGVPKAVLETHPTIPNQRAVMTTLIPKFALRPVENPEIIFVCDRSGSMQGTRIALARQALQIFLKSLPVGAMFNICSFGSSYSFLWPRSVSYSQKTLDEAIEHVRTLEANYGGTDMLQPLRATIQQRYKDIPLEVMVLTDGAICDQDVLFAYLNEQIQDTKAPIRVYSLGVGSGVSHALIEGIARAGNGFSQTVGEGEKMDSKVVRMLKGALSPHVNDYTLEVKYAGGMESLDEDEDYEIVERVADSLTVKLALSDKEDAPKPIKPISLFDPSADPDRSEPPAPGASHLPKVATPKIIQAPQTIPPLFAFNRTTVYLLLGPDAPHQTPRSVVLRGTSTHGPLELEFPIQVLDKPATTIHQLAAKKTTYELEQGRGWLSEAKDESGKLLKEQYESRFSSMVEREAVRLGVQFQVSGKWCSFVAVEKDTTSEKENMQARWEFLEDEPAPEPFVPQSSLFGNLGAASGSPSLFGGAMNQVVQDASGGLFQRDLASNPHPPGAPSVSAKPGNSGGGLFGSQSAAAPSSRGGLFGGSPAASASSSDSSGLRLSGFGTLNKPPFDPQAYSWGGSAQTPSTSGSLFGSATPAPAPSSAQHVQGGGIFGQQRGLSGPTAFGSVSSAASGQTANFFGGQQQQQQKMAQKLAQQQQQQLAQQMAQQQQMAQPQQATPFHQPSAVSYIQGNSALQDHQMPLMLLEQQNKKRLLMARQEQTLPRSAFDGTTHTGGTLSPPKLDDETLSLLISLQTFEGAWEYSPSLFLALKISEAAVEDARTVFNDDISLQASTGDQGEKVEYGKREWATSLAIVCFETKLVALQESWELIVDKAKVWLSGSVGTGRVEGMLGRAREFSHEVDGNDGSRARFGN